MQRIYLTGSFLFRQVLQNRLFHDVHGLFIDVGEYKCNSFTLAGFSGNNTLVLRKNYYGYTTLCETDFEWKMDEEYKISLLVS